MVYWSWKGRRLTVRCGRQRGVAGQARVHASGEVLPGLQGGGTSLDVAEVVGLEGIVVASAERRSRLDHLRHTACIRHRAHDADANN